MFVIPKIKIDLLKPLNNNAPYLTGTLVQGHVNEMRSIVFQWSTVQVQYSPVHCSTDLVQ